MPAKTDLDCKCPPSNCRKLVGRYAADKDGIGFKLSENVRTKIDGIVQGRLGGEYQSDWDDVRQIVLMRMFRKLPQWQRKKKFCHWVAVIAARSALTYIYNVAGGGENQELIDTPNPSAKVIDLELRDCIQHVFKKMTYDEQQVFQMRIEGFDIREIAEKMDAGERTIKSLLAKIRLKLSICYEMRPTGYGHHNG